MTTPQEALVAYKVAKHKDTTKAEKSRQRRIRALLSVLESQGFYDFHEGEFKSFVVADEGAPSEGQILRKLESMFKSVLD